MWNYTKNCLLFLLIVGISIGFVSSAYYVTNPNNCPNNYQSQTCSGSDLVCGYSGGVTYCYDMTSLSAKGTSTTTTGSGGTDYTCQDTTCNGGYILDCYAYDGGSPFCDNGGNFIVDRNSTCYSKHVQTTATASVFNQSTCSATCTSNYFQCDGSTTDGDGCEIAVTSCNSGHGTIQLNECYSSTAGNCTSTTYLDCDDSDADADPTTCNVGNGCEVQIGGACSVGTLSGTYAPTCSAGAGVCVISDQDIATTGNEVLWSNSTHPFLWLTHYGTSPIFNFTFRGSTNVSLHMNSSGVYWNGTSILGGSGGGNTTSEIWAVVNNGTFIREDTNESTRFNALTTNCTGTNKVRGVLDSGVIVCDTDVDTDTFNTTAEILAVETNESTRFNTLTTNCSASEQVWGVLDSGALVCVADATGAGGNTTAEIWAVANNGTFDRYKGYYNSSLINTTTLEDQGGKVSVLQSWIESLWETLWGTKDTDNLPEGTTNLYDNHTWNQSKADTLYADISQTDTNETTRFNTLTTNCSTSEQVFGILDTGELVCVTDATGSGGNNTEEIRNAVNNTGHYNMSFSRIGINTATSSDKMLDIDGSPTAQSNTFSAISSTPTITVTKNNSRLYGYSSGIQATASGSGNNISNLVGMYGYSLVSGGQYGNHVNKLIGAMVQTLGVSGADVDKSIGLYIFSVIGGAENWAILDESGKESNFSSNITMNGDLELSNNKICNATEGCPAYIYHNGSGWVVQG